MSLKIEAILGEVTIGQRKKKLDEMARGNGLSDAYMTTLTRLKGQKGNKSVLGWKVLMWVLYSQRPLRAEELCHALGVEIGSGELDPNNVPALRTLLASCLGLVTIEASSSRIRLVHFTLQEYLLSDLTLFYGSHSTIAEVCLTYLNFGCIRNISPTVDSAPSTTPLLEYASCYWGDHTRMGMTENVKILALRLLDRFDEHISAQILLLRYHKNRGSGPYISWVGGPIGFTGLHGVSFLGIVEIFANVLEMKEWDINATDFMGSTPLTWAAREGHEEVVKIILEREDVDPNQRDTRYGRALLSWAAERGNERVVKVLLNREDVNPNQADTSNGRTPLSWAAGKGNEGVVKMLLERKDVNPDQVDTKYDRTPHSWGAEYGPEWVLRMFSTRTTYSLGQVDTYTGRTPLSWAAESGHERVVRMLLEREDVNPDQAINVHGQTPLLWAAENGHEGVVRMFLERESVNPDRAETKYNRTPLELAAENGHEGIVKMFLEQEDVNPDRADNHGIGTPLLLAAENGHEGIVRMLLEQEDVNPDQVYTHHGQTPLSLAAQSGHDGVVKLLLEREDVNPNQVEIVFGRTPLSLAAQSGHEGVVKMFLERDDVNPNQPERYGGRTPLLWAADFGHRRVVKMLLERHDVRTTLLDHNNQTPLSLALIREYDVVVRILPGNSNSHTTDHGGQTSLSSSAGHGDGGAVGLEPQSHDPNTNLIDSNSHPPSPPADLDEREGVSGPKDSLSRPADSDLSSPKPPKRRRFRTVRS